MVLCVFLSMHLLTLSYIFPSRLSVSVADPRFESAMLRMPFALQVLMVLGRLMLCAKYHELCIIPIIFLKDIVSAYFA